MSKKGQSISINTIIIAAIALAVLVVLFMIFTGRLGVFSIGVKETTDCNNACIAAGYESGRSFGSSETCTPPGETILSGYYVPEGGERKRCCCSNIKSPGGPSSR